MFSAKSFVYLCRVIQPLNFSQSAYWVHLPNYRKTSPGILEHNVIIRAATM